MAPMNYPEIVEGARGRYERWDAGRHTDALVEACADPEVMRFLGGPMTAPLVEEMSVRIAQHWTTFGFGLWAAIDRASEEVAGFTGVCFARWHPEYSHEVEFAWRLVRRAWGRGLAGEGARLALDATWRHLHPPRVLAFVHPDNARSHAVCRRLGMPEVGETADPRLHEPLRIYELAPAAG
jgi:RimJ/RimL family protein N-acetyltransferase